MKLSSDIANLLSVAVAVLYAYFIMPKGQKTSPMLRYAADGLMAFLLVSLVAQGNRNLNVLVTLGWLGLNYVLNMDQNNVAWYAYDGFALSTLVSSVRA